MTHSIAFLTVLRHVIRKMLPSWHERTNTMQDNHAVSFFFCAYIVAAAPEVRTAETGFAISASCTENDAVVEYGVNVNLVFSAH